LLKFSVFLHYSHKSHVFKRQIRTVIMNHFLLFNNSLVKLTFFIHIQSLIVNNI